MAKVTFTDKNKTGVSPLNKWRDIDANEVKAAINALYDSLITDQFTMREAVTVTNTTTETSLIGEGSGSLTIEADKLIEGAYIQLRSYGYISTGATNRDATLRIKFGGVTLIASLGTLPANMTNSAISLNAVITCHTTGVTMAGYTLIQGGSGITTTNMRSLNVPVEVAVDLSEDCAVEHTYQWTTAAEANSITLTNFEVLVK